MCGAPLRGGAHFKVNVDGAVLTVCQQCFARLGPKAATSRPWPPNSSVTQGPTALKLPQPPGPRRPQPTGGPARRDELLATRYELVDDYAQRVRKAREALGWSPAVLAERLKVSENVVRRIESGRLRPPYELARRLEEVLKVKLLVPAVEEEVKATGEVKRYVTLGEIVNVRTSG